jgi:Fe-S-cluster containining protein
VDFTYPIRLRFDCNKCGLCCGDTKQKTRHILLLETEAQKISSENSSPIADFSIEISDKPPFHHEMKKTSEGKCFFLKDNRCRIYALRPLICMFYPFELKSDVKSKQYVFDFTVECPGISQGKVFSQKDFRKLFEIAQERLR